MRSNVEMLRYRLSGVLFPALALLLVSPTDAAEGAAHDASRSKRGLSQKAPEGTIGVCRPVLNKDSIDPVEDERGLYALSVIDHAAGLYAHNPGKDPLVGLENAKSRVAVLTQPKHGKLRQGLSLNDLSYYPHAGYSGRDKAVFLVKQDDHRIKVVYFFRVVRGTDNQEFGKAYSRYCSPPGWWKISREQQGTDHASGVSLVSGSSRPQRHPQGGWVSASRR